MREWREWGLVVGWVVRSWTTRGEAATEGQFGVMPTAHLRSHREMGLQNLWLRELSRD